MEIAVYNPDFSGWHRYVDAYGRVFLARSQK
jgi:hypothetical protein